MKRTRDHWSGTSNYSVLCEKHLTDDSFEPDSAIAATMGLAKRKRLKYGAIPTVLYSSDRGSRFPRRLASPVAVVFSTRTRGRELPALPNQERASKLRLAEVWLNSVFA